jgi:hypothetical protein
MSASETRRVVPAPVLIRAGHPMRTDPVLRERWSKLHLSSTTHHFGPDAGKDIASVRDVIDVPLVAVTAADGRVRAALDEFAALAGRTAEALVGAIAEASADLNASGSAARDAKGDKEHRKGLAKTRPDAQFWVGAGHTFRTLAHSGCSDGDVAAAGNEIRALARREFDAAVSDLDCADPRRARAVNRAQRSLWARTRPVTIGENEHG